MSSADLAIQIVNYKTKAFLNPLLESIVQDVATSKLKVEINILDNASGDNLDDIGKKWHLHDVHIYTANKNKGFGAGHNLLSTKTKAKLLLILNPDLLLIEKRTIKRLIGTLERTQATVVGPRLLTPKIRTKTPGSTFPINQLTQQRWDHGTGSLKPYRPTNKIKEVTWVSGAVFLIEYEAFKDIGGFDEKFFLYYEELDLCLRLRKKSMRVIYDPTVQVLHYSSVVANKSKHLPKSFLYYQYKKLKAL